METHYTAYVYLTCGTDLLVFDEPDTPHLGWQVPGGTVDPGESFLHGAMREFEEETGLTLDAAFEHFSDQEIDFESIAPVGQFKPAPDPPLKGRHIRRNYHAAVAQRPKDTREHYKMHPGEGVEPFRCRFFRIDLFSAEEQNKSKFFAAFWEPLSALCNRLHQRRYAA